MSMSLQIVVDASRCQGHARCYMTCPDVFEIDDQGQSRVKLDVIPDYLRERALRAVEACPESALTAIEKP